MSRYEKDLGTETLSVGWDRPMNTFFAQVHRKWQQVSNDVRTAIYNATGGHPDSYGKAIEEAEYQLNKDELKLWLGSNFDEFPFLAELKDRLEKEGYELPRDLQTQLVSDCRFDDNPRAENLTDGWKQKL